MSRLFEIAQGIAPLLDGSWRYNRLEEARHGSDWMHRAVLHDPACPNRQIIVSGIWNKPDRLCFRGRIPHGHIRTRITVAKRRDIPSIAADVNRRFLPGFADEAEAAKACHDHRQAELEAYRHQVDILRRFLPGFRHSHSQTLTGSDEFYFQGGSVRMYSSGYEAELTLSLPFDDLVRVLMFIYSEDANR